MPSLIQARLEKIAQPGSLGWKISNCHLQVRGLGHCLKEILDRRAAISLLWASRHSLSMPAQTEHRPTTSTTSIITVKIWNLKFSTQIRVTFLSPRNQCEREINLRLGRGVVTELRHHGDHRRTIASIGRSSILRSRRWQKTLNPRSKLRPCYQFEQA